MPSSSGSRLADREGVARHEIALPLITDPCTDSSPVTNATDALWTQTARVQSRPTSTGLYIRNVLTCRFATWLDEELLASTACGGLIIRRSWVRAPPAPPAVSMSGQRWPWTDVGGAVTSCRRHAEHPHRSRRATSERVLVGGAHDQSTMRDIHRILSGPIDAAQRWEWTDRNPAESAKPPPSCRQIILATSPFG